MNNVILTEENIGYLEEMMNIGAGNAVGALEQILQDRLDMCIPTVHIVPPREAFSVIGDPSEPVTCVKMNLVGDIRGEIFFIVPQAAKAHVTELAVRSAHVENRDGADASIIEEIGNILAGVYLTAIHDFCRLSIYHTLPITAHDMTQAVLDETIARSGMSASILILIINEFTSTLLNGETINTFLILIPAKDSEGTLLDSIRGAREKICDG